MSKGKQPRTRVNKVPKLLLSETKVVFILNGQEIGLEAAIFLRSRNRALVFHSRVILLTDKSTENLTDLNNIPTPCPYIYILCMWGSGTLGNLNIVFILKIIIKWKIPSDNADMSNDKGILSLA